MLRITDIDASISDTGNANVTIFDGKTAPKEAFAPGFDASDNAMIRKAVVDPKTNVFVKTVPTKKGGLLLLKVTTQHQTLWSLN